MMLALLLACSSGQDDSAVSCDREPALTFENFGSAFLATHCTGCHSVLHTGNLREGAPEGIDLNTYADVLLWANRIEARALESVDMPPGGGPSQDERNLLEEWLYCGIYPDIETLEGAE